MTAKQRASKSKEPPWLRDLNRLKSRISLGAKLRVKDLPAVLRPEALLLQSDEQVTLGLLDILGVKLRVESDVPKPKPKPEVTYPHPVRIDPKWRRLEELLRTSEDFIVRTLNEQSRRQEEQCAALQPVLDIHIPTRSTYPHYDELPLRMPKQKATLLKDQHARARLIYEKFVHKDYYADLLRAGAGTGKTFVLGRLFRCLIDIEFFKGKTFSPWEILLVTKAPVVEQTERVFEQLFGLNTATEVIVTNYEQLRAKLGKNMVRNVTRVKNGEACVEWEWLPNVHPCMIAWDECQALKNEDSLQAKIGLSFSRIVKPHTYQIFSSATPFTRVCEAKAFALATKARR